MAAPLTVQDVVNLANAQITSGRYPNIMSVLGGRSIALGWIMGIIQLESQFRVGVTNTTARGYPAEARLIGQLEAKYPNIPNTNILYAGTAIGLMQGLGAYCIQECKPLGFSLTGTGLNALVSNNLYIPLSTNVYTLFDPNSLGDVTKAATNEIILGLAVLEWKCSLQSNAWAAVQSYYGDASYSAGAKGAPYISYPALAIQDYYVAHRRLTEPLIVAPPTPLVSTATAAPTNQAPVTQSSAC